MEDCSRVAEVVKKAVEASRAFYLITSDIISYEVYERILNAVVESLNRPREDVERCVMQTLGEMGLYVAF